MPDIHFSQLRRSAKTEYLVDHSGLAQVMDPQDKCHVVIALGFLRRGNLLPV
jgi:hypothetical protein